MPLRWLAAGSVVVALLSGCASTPSRWSSGSPKAADPDRWERAVCRLGTYPAELDSRALTWARYDDLRASQSGGPSPFAAAQLLSERQAFEVRCAAWRATRAGAAPSGATAQVQ